MTANGIAGGLAGEKLDAASDKEVNRARARANMRDHMMKTEAGGTG